MSQNAKSSRRTSRRIRLLLVSVLFLAIILMLLLPVPIQPAKWVAPTPPTFTEDNQWAENHKLSNAELISDAPTSPEFITFDASGQLYTGDADGKIYRIAFDENGLAQAATVYADTQGTPNGMKFDQLGNLIVADIQKGLLSISPAGDIKVLANEVDGDRIYLANALDIAKDGTIYFSDTSTYGRVTFTEMAENKPHGRLLKYDPTTELTTVLLEDLYFANGVVLSRDEDFVLVAESYRYQVTRYWLTGPQQGTSDLFIDNLAGFPDNLSIDEDGQFWLGLFTTRLSFVDLMHRNPWIARVMSKVPESLLSGASAPAKHGLAVKISPQGELLESWHDPAGDLYGVTTAINREGYLYIGTAPGGSTGLYRIAMQQK